MRRVPSARVAAGGGVVLLLCLVSAGCPTMAITMGAKTAAHIIADDRSLAQQTSDMELKGQIENAILNESSTLAERVDVDVFLGSVMLTGVVPDADARWTASRIARQTAGGAQVYDDIEVGASGGVRSAADDFALNKTLGVNLLANEGLASQSLLHRVVNGTAFVMGEAQDEGQIETVRSVALQTPGITRVVTHIVLEE